MTTTQTNVEGELVVATTPHKDSLVGIAGFLTFVRKWRLKDPRIRTVVIVMPSQTKASVSEQIIAMLQAGEHLVEMSPAAGGCGALFQFALDSGFRLAPRAVAVLHVPIDVAWGEVHKSDIQRKILEMMKILDSKGPDLLLGYYQPAVWRNGKSERHVTKELTGRAACVQLEHYGMDAVLRHTSFKQPDTTQARTEIFVARRAVHESAVQAGAFAPYDPIPFVALHALETGFEVKIVNLGTFYEKDAGRDANRACDQVLRFALQVAHAYMRRQQSTRGAEVSAQAGTWRQIVIAGIEKALDAMAAIREEIDQGAFDRPRTI